MMSPPNSAPPRGAAWLLTLFANAEEAESIFGDLEEEFSRLGAHSGIDRARRWYWRQTLKSLPHLVFSAFRASPWTAMIAVVAGFLLRRLISRVPGLATFAVIERFAIYEHHFSLYIFLASTALDIEHIFTFLLVGCFVALIARRREMAPATVLAVIFGAMALAGAIVGSIRSSDYGSLWRLQWYFSDSLAVVAGAVVVRMLRSKARNLRVQ